MITICICDYFIFEISSRFKRYYDIMEFNLILSAFFKKKSDIKINFEYWFKIINFCLILIGFFKRKVK